jgi:hypothetical protein
MAGDERCLLALRVRRVSVDRAFFIPAIPEASPKADLGSERSSPIVLAVGPPASDQFAVDREPVRRVGNSDEKVWE